MSGLSGSFNFFKSCASSLFLVSRYSFSPATCVFWAPDLLEIPREFLILPPSFRTLDVSLRKPFILSKFPFPHLAEHGSQRLHKNLQRRPTQSPKHSASLRSVLTAALGGRPSHHWSRELTPWSQTACVKIPAMLLMNSSHWAVTSNYLSSSFWVWKMGHPEPAFTGFCADEWVKESRAHSTGSAPSEQLGLF